MISQKTESFGFTFFCGNRKGYNLGAGRILGTGYTFDA
jgi:hypothetical protein